MAQRRRLDIGGLKRVSLLRFFSRLKRNEVPPRTGANSNKQENTTYAERPREQKDSTFSPHSPRAAPRPHSPRVAPRPHSPRAAPPKNPRAPPNRAPLPCGSHSPRILPLNKLLHLRRVI